MTNTDTFFKYEYLKFKKTHMSGSSIIIWNGNAKRQTNG